jgi:hypothetical protein
MKPITIDHITDDDLRAAAAQNDLDAALGPLMDKAGIEDGTGASIHLDDYGKERWLEGTIDERITQLREWLTSEVITTEDIVALARDEAGRAAMKRQAEAAGWLARAMEVIGENLTAWEGEEGSVRDKHADMIAGTLAFVRHHAAWEQGTANTNPDIIATLVDALQKMRTALNNWMDIADDEDDRESDHAAMAAADAALAQAEAAQHSIR